MRRPVERGSLHIQENKKNDRGDAKMGKRDRIKCSDSKFSLLETKSISSSHEHMTKCDQIRDTNT